MKSRTTTFVSQVFRTRRRRCQRRRKWDESVYRHNKSRVERNVLLAKVGDRVDEIFRAMSIRGIDRVIAHM